MKLFIFVFSLLLTFPAVAHKSDHYKNVNNNFQISLNICNLSDSVNQSQIKVLDSIYIRKDNKVTELFMIGKKAYKGTDDNYTFVPFKGHWSGFNYGFINFTNTDYSMYSQEEGKFMDLDWTHSFALQFNIIKYSLSLVPRNNFGLVCGLGFEYQRLRFENNYLSISNIDHKIVPIYLHDTPEITKIKRSTFKNLYLTIPILMEVQFPASYKKRMYVSGGFMGGVRISSKTKVVYQDLSGDWHKKKEKGHFDQIPFKVDVLAKIGYSCVNVWGSYSLTPMFKSNKGPKLHAYTLGLGITF